MSEDTSHSSTNEDNHQWQRSGVHPAKLPVDQLMKDCKLTQTRRGGPGGQHRNKTESAVVVTHQPSGIAGQAGERRSQHQNRSVAIQRLRINLALGIRTEVLEPTPPSTLWTSRRKNGQIKVNSDHTDFPAILAEALDFCAAENFELENVSHRLQISKTQLINLLKQEPAAFQLLNRQRQLRGFSLLK